MTTPVGGTGSGAHDEVLAGEYVLGALSPDTARLVEARLKTDRQFAAIVRRWQDNLSDADEADSDPWLVVGNMHASGPAADAEFSMPARGVWQSFAFWRGFGIAMLALLALYAVFEVQNTAAPVKGAASVLTAIYDPAAGRVAVDAVPASAPRLRIWVIEKTGQAHMLGELPDNGSIALDSEMKRLMADGANLAVAPAD